MDDVYRAGKTTLQFPVSCAGNVLCLRQSRLTGGIMLSVRPFIHPSIRYQTCEHDCLKKNEPISMKMSTGGPRART